LKKSSKIFLVIAIILFAYVLIIGGYILWWNQRAGGLIQGWYHEYMGADGEIHGSGKWRIPIFFEDPTLDARKGFPEFALLFGSWIYPFSVIAILIFAKNIFVIKENKKRLFFAAGILFSLLVLCSFLYLGVWTAVQPR
jgi:hypothetical protein